MGPGPCAAVYRRRKEGGGWEASGEGKEGAANHASKQQALGLTTESSNSDEQWRRSSGRATDTGRAFTRPTPPPSPRLLLLLLVLLVLLLLLLVLLLLLLLLLLLRATCSCLQPVVSSSPLLYRSRTAFGLEISH